MEEPEVHNDRESQSKKTVYCKPQLHGIPENSKTIEILKTFIGYKTIYVCVWGGCPIL